MNGLGVDVIEIDRVERAVSRWGDRFLRRIYTEAEIAYCNRRSRPAPSLAVRFAAKEAFAKAVETSMTPGWREVEVAIEPDGKPRIALAPRLQALIQPRRIRISLSHSENIAIAAVLID